VLVLPNNSNVILTAEQAVSMSTKNVRVVPSRSVQSGLAAMTGFMSSNSIEDNEASMLGELQGAASGEITVASRSATIDGVEIREGEYLGLVDEVAVMSNPDLDAVVHEVVDRILANGRGFLTVLTGEDAPPMDTFVGAIEERHPGVEVEVHEGGQPHYPLLLVAQ
jgi:hypothetical protein